MQDIQPALQSTPTVDTARIQKTNKLKTTWGIICLVAPTALFILSLVAYFILHFATGGGWQYAHGDSSLFADPPIVQTIGNIILFIVGAVTVITWLPGIIIGIVLLATRQRV